MYIVDSIIVLNVISLWNFTFGQLQIENIAMSSLLAAAAGGLDDENSTMVVDGLGISAMVDGLEKGEGRRMSAEPSSELSQNLSEWKAEELSSTVELLHNNLYANVVGIGKSKIPIHEDDSPGASLYVSGLSKLCKVLRPFNTSLPRLSLSMAAQELSLVDNQDSINSLLRTRGKIEKEKSELESTLTLFHSTSDQVKKSLMNYQSSLEASSLNEIKSMTKSYESEIRAEQVRFWNIFIF